MQKLSSYVVASPIFSEDNAPLLVVLATRTGAVFELPLSIWQALRLGAFEKLNAKLGPSCRKRRYWCRRRRTSSRLCCLAIARRSGPILI